MGYETYPNTPKSAYRHTQVFSRIMDAFTLVICHDDMSYNVFQGDGSPQLFFNPFGTPTASAILTTLFGHL